MFLLVRYCVFDTFDHLKYILRAFHNVQYLYSGNITWLYVQQQYLQHQMHQLLQFNFIIYFITLFLFILSLYLSS